MRVYLAGPDVFLPNAMDVLSEKIAICTRHGFIGVAPFDAGMERPPATPDGARTIGRRNEELMRGCDFLVANMTPFRGPSMDVGTAYEMGFMRSLGRSVLGYSNVTDRLRERTVQLFNGREAHGVWFDAYGMAIEDFQLGDNLMVDAAVLESESAVIRAPADPGTRFTDLTAFTECMRVAATLADRGRIRGCRTYYEGRPWTLTRVGDAACRFWRLVKQDHQEGIRILGHHLEALYLLRVPLLTLTFLLALPAVAFGTFRPLLENLFVDLGFWEIFCATLAGFLTAASAVAVVNAVLVNGHERFEWLALGKYYGGPFHWLAIGVPVPLVWAVAAHSRLSPPRTMAAVAFGVLAALTLVLWVGIEQEERSRRLQTNPRFPHWRSRPLVYPRQTPFDTWTVENWKMVLKGASGISHALLAWILLLPWCAAKLAQMARRLVAPVFEVCGVTRQGAIGRRVAEGVKGLFPQAGFIYVPPDEGPQRPLYSAPHYLLLLNVILFFVWVLIGVGKLAIPRLPVPALAYLVFTVWVGCLFVSGLTFLLDRYRIPLLSLVLIWLAIGSRFFTNDHYYTTRTTPLAADYVSGGPELRAGALLDQRSTQPVIVVAAAGGGIQAAAWTARVLTGLAHELPNQFGPAVVLLSGVSGGSVGVYQFANAYHDGGLTDDSLAGAYAAASASSLDDVAWGLATFDMPGAVLPLSIVGLGGVDRGWALERAFAAESRAPGVAAPTLSVWEDDVRNHRRPAVMLNATLVESGAPIVFGTTRVEPGRPPEAWYKPVDFRSLRVIDPPGADRQADMTLDTAVRLSATFPFVTPVATSDAFGDVELSQHVADGGYYDNFGMVPLLAWLDDGLSGGDRRPSRILVLQIRSFPQSKALRGREATRGPIFQTYAPLTTLTSVRNAAQRWRNEQDFDHLKRYWEERPSPVLVTTAEIDFEYDPADAGQEPPLSWRLNHAQLGAIERAWIMRRGPLKTTVEAFLDTPAAAQPHK